MDQQETKAEGFNPTTSFTEAAIRNNSSFVNNQKQQKGSVGVTVLPGCGEEKDEKLCMVIDIEIGEGFTLDHATQAHLDAITSSLDILPLDETKTKPLEKKKKQEEQEETTTPKKETENNKNDDDDDQEQQHEDKEEKEETPAAAPAPAPTVEKSTKKPPHQPCYLLKGDYRKTADPGSIGVAMHPFHVAALVGNVEGLRNYKEKYGVDALKEETKDKRSIFEIAIRSQQLSVIKFLLEECKMSMHTVNEHGSSPLMICAWMEGHQQLKEEKEKEKEKEKKVGEEKEQEEEDEDKKQKKPIRIAEYVLENYSREETQSDFANERGESILTWSLIASNFRVVDLLIEKHNITSLSPKIPVPSFLEGFVTRSNYKAVEYLFDKLNVKLDFDVTENSLDIRAPMAMVALAATEDDALKFFEIFRKQLEKDGSFKGTPKQTNPSLIYDVGALHWAARHGYTKLIDKFREIGLANTKQQIDFESTLVGTPLMFASTPIGVSSVVYLVETLGASTVRTFHRAGVSLLSRLLYWDAKSFSYLGPELETDAYLKYLKTGEEFHDAVVYLLKHNKIDPNGEYYQDIINDRLQRNNNSNNKKNDAAANRRTAYVNLFLKDPETYMDHPVSVSPNCSLPSGLALIDFGAEYSNDSKLRHNLGRTTYANKFHELRMHWLRYFYRLYGYSSSDVTTTDIKNFPYANTMYIGCDIVADNAKRVYAQENYVQGSITDPVKKAAAKKKAINVDYARMKEAQILSNYESYRSQTTILGQMTSSFLNSSANLVSAGGFVKFLQERVAANCVSYLHGTLGWFRNKDKW